MPPLILGDTFKQDATIQKMVLLGRYGDQ